MLCGICSRVVIAGIVAQAVIVAVDVVVAASRRRNRNRLHSADFHEVVVACHPLTWPRGRWEVRETFAIGGGP